MKPLTKVAENDAAGVVAGKLGGRIEPKDVPGAPDGTHDFDILLHNGSVIALEVTSTSEPEAVSIWEAIHRQNWEAPTLQKSWTITIPHPIGQSGVRIKELRKRIVPLLETLNRYGVADFGAVMTGALDWPDGASLAAREAICTIIGLGVTAGTVIAEQDPTTPRHVALGTVGPGSAVDAEALNRSVELAAAENHKKLARAKADHRHLFVWATGLGDAVPMELDILPKQVPRIPLSIDVVWVATWGPGVSYKTNASRLCRITPPGGWEKIPDPSPATSDVNPLAG